MKKYFFIIIFVFNISCDNSISVSDDLSGKIAVSLILNPSESRQKALISFVNKISHYNGRPTFVDSAFLRIDNTIFSNICSTSLVSNNDCNGFGMNITNCYNYFTDSLLIIEGTEYTLELVYQDIKISGSTVIPGDFVITTSGKIISWTKSSNAVFYRITVTNSGKFLWEATTSQLSVQINNTDFRPGIYLIKVEAFEENFYNLFKEKTPSSGIVGGYGVLGAVTVKVKETSLD